MKAKEKAGRKLADAIAKEIRKEGPKGLRFSITTGASGSVGMTIEPPKKYEGLWIDVDIDEGADRWRYLAENRDRNPTRLRVKGNYTSYFRPGRYKLKDGSLSDDQMSKLVKRIVDAINRHIDMEERKLEEDCREKTNFARACRVLNAAGYKRTHPYYRHQKLPPVSECTSGYFGPKKGSGFCVEVKGLHYLEGAEVEGIYRMPFDLLPNLLDSMREHHDRLETLNERAERHFERIQDESQ